MARNLIPADMTDIEFLKWLLQKGNLNNDLKEKFLKVLERYYANHKKIAVYCEEQNNAEHFYLMGREYKSKKNTSLVGRYFFDIEVTPDSYELNERLPEEAKYTSIKVCHLKDNIVKVMMRQTTYYNKMVSTYIENVFDDDKLIHAQSETVERAFSYDCQVDEITNSELYVDNDEHKAILGKKISYPSKLELMGQNEVEEFHSIPEFQPISFINGSIVDAGALEKIENIVTDKKAYHQSLGDICYKNIQKYAKI